MFPKTESDLSPEQLAWLREQPAEVRVQFWKTPLGVPYRIKRTGALAALHSYLLPKDGGPLMLTLQVMSPAGRTVLIREVPPEEIEYCAEVDEAPSVDVIRSN